MYVYFKDLPSHVLIVTNEDFLPLPYNLLCLDSEK